MFERVKALFKDTPAAVDARWPFEDARNTAVFTTRHVFRLGKPILYVSRDAEDGAWQFHSGGPARTADAMVVALKEVLNHDSSIAELADLPPGWNAERTAVGQPWERKRT